jgi:hypothetical protein
LAHNVESHTAQVLKRAFTIGLIEGAAESTALIVKIFSGALSDYWGKRKPPAAS